MSKRQMQKQVHSVRSNVWRWTIGAALGLAMAGAAAAQSFPSHPITLIYTFGTGTASEVVMRMLGTEVSKTLGQPVIVDIKAGANGRLGILAQKNAPGDGHLLSFVTNSTVVLVPMMDSGFRIEPGKDYTPMLAVQLGPFVLTAIPSLQIKDLQSLIAYVKANPGKLNNGNTGTGSIQHIATGLLNDAAGVNFVPVPYKGEGLVVQALLGGEIQTSFIAVTNKPNMDAGKLVPIAVTSPQRLPQLPNVPTIAEAGYPKFGSVGFWTGIVAPPETPRDVVIKLNTAFASALRSPALVKFINDGGSVVLGGTADDFTNLIRTDSERMRPVVEKLGIKLQ